MPAITSDELGIAVDLNGCPNRCRHCYLGSPGNIRRPHEQLRSVVGLFRAFVNSDANRTPVRRLAVRSWCWEPDYSDDYRELYALEKELGDSGPYRHELLSVWRLATDPSPNGRKRSARTPARYPSSAWKRPPIGSTGAEERFATDCAPPRGFWKSG